MLFALPELEYPPPTLRPVMMGERRRGAAAPLRRLRAAQTPPSPHLDGLGGHCIPDGVKALPGAVDDRSNCGVAQPLFGV